MINLRYLVHLLLKKSVIFVRLGARHIYLFDTGPKDTLICYKMSVINQKEYLKKYMSTDDDSVKKKKRKKKKSAGISDRMKIIDDNEEAAIFTKAVEEDLYSEDAPQIVGVIDERPLELRIDDYRKSDLWKPVGAQTASEIISSPPRRHKHKNMNHSDIESASPRQSKAADDDYSPPRRRDKIDADFSPPRKHLRNRSPPLSKKYRGRSADYDSRKKSDSAIKQQRRHTEDDASPPRLKKILEDRRYDDSNPPRRKKNEVTRYNDDSPPRRRKIDESYTSHQRKDDTTTRNVRNVDLNRQRSPPRKDRGKCSDANQSKATRTLDGKTAGLQNANDLAKETELWKKREDDLFKNMSTEISGQNAKAIVRDRKTGKIRNFKKEAEEESKRKEREAENQEKYAKWGKGLKQVEDHNEKVSNELYEMSKPLARYADDEDLERYLKEQEREGDPMLDYIRKKKKKKQEIEQKPIKPQYEGEFMPNRYGIHPGYRWDGVDRSNGYERKWFEVLNSRKAMQEEVYKWSTEDM